MTTSLASITPKAATGIEGLDDILNALILLRDFEALGKEEDL